MKTKAIICDLDDTLALIGDRDPYKTELAGQDKLNKAVAEVLKHFHPDYEILIVSGREENHKEVTVKWLIDNRIVYSKLLMRPSGNHETTGIELKKQFYLGYIEPNYEVLFALDDMFKICEMYRELGVPCFQVAKERFLK